MKQFPKFPSIFKHVFGTEIESGIKFKKVLISVSWSSMWVPEWTLIHNTVNTINKPPGMDWYVACERLIQQCLIELPIERGFQQYAATLVHYTQNSFCKILLQFFLSNSYIYRSDAIIQGVSKKGKNNLWRISDLKSPVVKISMPYIIIALNRTQLRCILHKY